VLWRPRCERRLGPNTCAQSPNLALVHLDHPMGRADAPHA
jgi:hypothetical protein